MCAIIFRAFFLLGEKEERDTSHGCDRSSAPQQEKHQASGK